MVDIEIVAIERATLDFYVGAWKCISSLCENEIELKSNLGSNCHHNGTDVLFVNVKEVTSVFILIDSAMWLETQD